MSREKLIAAPLNELSQRSPGETEEIQENVSTTDSAAQMPNAPCVKLSVGLTEQVSLAVTFATCVRKHAIFLPHFP